MSVERAVTSLQRINYLTAEIDAAYHDAAKKMGISDSAMQILYAVCNYGEPCPLREVTRLLGISKQTINSALRKLESEGILYLKPFGLKKKMIYLTPLGKSLAQQTVLRLIEIENEILDSWSKEDQEIYVSLMKRFLDQFNEKIDRLEKKEEDGT